LRFKDKKDTLGGEEAPHPRSTIVEGEGGIIKEEIRGAT